jgi:hypothetical protein
MLSFLPAGVILAGSGKAQVPSLPDSPGKPLSRRGLHNLTAYARLYGYVRHFHPSDEAEVADWTSLTLAGVRAVEEAPSQSALAVALQQSFGSVAPTLRVFLKDVPVSRWQPPVGHKDLKKVFWRHRGYRVETKVPDWMSWWTRQRILAPIDGPPEVSEIDLGDGLLAEVPLTLLADAVGTLPHAPGVEPRAPVRAEPSSFSGADRTTRLAAVIIAWNAFEHFYPYFDVVNANWPHALTTALQSAATTTAKGFLTTLRRMTAAAHDGHCRVFWDADPDPDAVAPLGWDLVEGQLVVTDVPDSQGQSIELGDLVHSIDGKRLTDLLREAEEEISAATPQWRRARALNHVGVTKRRFGSFGEGPKSRPLILELASRHDPKRLRRVSLERRDPPRTPVREHRPMSMSELRPGVVYVDLTSMRVSDWQGALTRMTRASGLIFDVRGYPNLTFDILGNLSRSPMLQQRWYAPVITHPDRRRWEFDLTPRHTVHPREPYLEARKVFLTDGRARSFAESLVAMVAHYKLGEIVGETTAGTSGNANTINLPGGYGIYFTGEKVLNNDGSRFHGVGVKPTIAAYRTLDGVAARRDEVLERALQLFELSAA